METIKLTQEELSSITQMQNEESELVLKFGQLEYKIQTLELEKEQLIENINSLKLKEQEVANSLQEKYGDGSIDLETGIFTKHE